jgi:drug/metabolite transporter (DMT)-like permease
MSATGFALGRTAARLALADGSNTITIVALRGLIGMVLMAFLIRAEGSGFVVPCALLTDCVLAGLASAVVSYGLIGAVSLMPVSAAVVIFFTHPLLIALMWHLQVRERLSPLRFPLAAVVLLGVFLSVGGSLRGLVLGA